MDVDEEGKEAADGAAAREQEAEECFSGGMFVACDDQHSQLTMPSSCVALLLGCLSIPTLAGSVALVSKGWYHEVFLYGQRLSAARIEASTHAWDEDATQGTQMHTGQYHMQSMITKIATRKSGQSDESEGGASAATSSFCSSSSSSSASSTPASFPFDASLYSRLDISYLSPGQVRAAMHSPLRHLISLIDAETRQDSAAMTPASISQLAHKMPTLRGLSCTLSSGSFQPTSEALRFPPRLRTLLLKLAYKPPQRMSKKQQRDRDKPLGKGWSAEQCQTYAVAVLRAVGEQLQCLTTLRFNNKQNHPFFPTGERPSQEWLEPLLAGGGAWKPRLRYLLQDTVLAPSWVKARAGDMFAHDTGALRDLQAMYTPTSTLPSLMAINPQLRLSHFPCLPPNPYPSQGMPRDAGHRMRLQDKDLPSLKLMANSLLTLTPFMFHLCASNLRQLDWLGAFKRLIRLAVREGKEDQWADDPLALQGTINCDSLAASIVQLVNLEHLEMSARSLTSMHMAAIAEACPRVRQLHVGSHMTDLQWVSDGGSDPNRLPHRLTHLDLFVPMCPPDQVEHLFSLKHIEELSIQGSFSGPLLTSQLYRLTKKGGALYKAMAYLRCFIPRSQHEVVPPEPSFSAPETIQANFEQFASAVAQGSLVSAQTIHPDQLSPVFACLDSMRDFIAAGQVCRTWKQASERATAWPANGRRQLKLQQGIGRIPTWMAGRVQTLPLFKAMSGLACRVLHYDEVCKSIIRRNPERSKLGDELKPLFHLNHLVSLTIDLQSYIHVGEVRRAFVHLAPRLTELDVSHPPAGVLKPMVNLRRLKLSYLFWHSHNMGSTRQWLIPQRPMLDLLSMHALETLGLAVNGLCGSDGEVLRELSSDHALRKLTLQIYQPGRHVCDTEEISPHPRMIREHQQSVARNDAFFRALVGGAGGAQPWDGIETHSENVHHANQLASGTFDIFVQGSNCNYDLIPTLIPSIAKEVAETAYEEPSRFNTISSSVSSFGQQLTSGFGAMFGIGAPTVQHATASGGPLTFGAAPAAAAAAASSSSGVSFGGFGSSGATSFGFGTPVGQSGSGATSSAAAAVAATPPADPLTHPVYRAQLSKPGSVSKLRSLDVSYAGCLQWERGRAAVDKEIICIDPVWHLPHMQHFSFTHDARRLEPRDLSYIEQQAVKGARSGEVEAVDVSNAPSASLYLAPLTRLVINNTLVPESVSALGAFEQMESCHLLHCPLADGVLPRLLAPWSSTLHTLLLDECPLQARSAEDMAALERCSKLRLLRLKGQRHMPVSHLAVLTRMSALTELELLDNYGMKMVHREWTSEAKSSTAQHEGVQIKLFQGEKGASSSSSCGSFDPSIVDVRSLVQRMPHLRRLLFTCHDAILVHDIELTLEHALGKRGRAGSATEELRKKKEQARHRQWLRDLASQRDEALLAVEKNGSAASSSSSSALSSTPTTRLQVWAEVAPYYQHERPTRWQYTNALAAHGAFPAVEADTSFAADSELLDAERANEQEAIDAIAAKQTKKAKASSRSAT